MSKQERGSHDRDEPFDLAVLLELVLLGDLPPFELQGLHFDVAFGEQHLEVVDVVADGA